MTMNFTTLIITSLLLIVLGAGVAASSNELMRVLIGLEMMFLGAVMSILLLYLQYPVLSFAILLICLGTAVAETVIMIGLIYRMVRLGYRATTSFKEKYTEE